MADTGHTTEILEQIQFGAALGAFPMGTHPGSVRLYINPTDPGKSQISHRKTDLTGHAPGSALADPGFFATYSWMGTAATPDQLTAGFKIGFKTSEFGLAPVSGKTGENAWDKLLVYEPTYNGNASDGNWHTESITRTSGSWWFVDRAATVPGSDFIWRTISNMETSTDRYGGNPANHTYAELYALLTSGIITSIQFGIGSGVQDVDLYVNQLATSFYRPGDVTTFGPGLRVHNVTQATDYVMIQSAINAANPGDFITCDAGNYFEDVLVNKPVTLSGAGIDVSTIYGMPGGDNAAVRMAAIGSVLEGFTITRLGNNPIDWHDTALNTAGVAIQTTGGAIVRNNKFVGNRTGIDINNAGGNQVLNNVIDFNRTGMVLRNLCPNNTIEQNLLTNNWTLGLLYLGNAGAGADLTGTVVRNNSLSGNWYAQLEGREINPGAYLWNVSGNWLGSASLTTINTDGTEPGYSAQIPVAYGGTAVNPGGAYSVRGVGLNYIDYTPWLNVGTDTNVETSMGRGTIGFQGNYSALWVDDIVAQTTNPIVEGLGQIVGSTLYISPGSYTGQVHAVGFSDLNIIGSGVANTFIKAPATTMPDTYTAGGINRPILFLENCTAHISDLTVDGDGNGNNNNRMTGIAFWNSDGSLTDVDIVEVRDTPFSGVQAGVGLSINHNGGNVPDVDVTNVSISDFQKNATSFAGAGTIVDCDNVTIVGAGPTGVTAQNGFQYGAGTTGTITNTTVSDICYTGVYWTSSGGLFDGDVNMTDVDFLNQQTGVYYFDGDGSYNGGTVTTSSAQDSTNGIVAWAYSAAASVPRVHPAPYEELGGSAPGGGSSLDDNEAYAFSNLDVIGTNAAVSTGILAYSSGGDLTITVNNCTVAGWTYGVDLTAFGGTISAGSVTNNTIGATANYDNTTGHTWNANCYSDFTTNAGFPATYQVDGGTNVDYNPNPAACSNVDMIVTSDYIGCELACAMDTLYLTFDQVGFINGQVFLKLPTPLDADWPLGNGYHSVMPGVNVAPNLVFAAGRRIAVDTLEINLQWSPPYSNGDGTKYVACIPLKYEGGATDGDEFVIGGYSSVFYNISGPQTNAYLLGTASIYFDCEDPGASIGYTSAPACSGYRTSTAYENLFTVTVTRGLAPNSQLASGYVRVNGNNAQQISLFNTVLVGDYTNASFPSAAEASTIWGWLNEGCNTLEVVAVDNECNEVISLAANLTKDTDAPDITVGNTSSFCYNDDPASSQYGGAYLDDYLDINTVLNSNALPAGCYAAPGTFEISYNGGTPMSLPLDLVANYPDASTIAALWTWIMLETPDTANGSSYTFDLEVCDCAGNCATSSFTICLDVVDPGNTFTSFNARPTDLGVWLNWSWNYNATQAVKAEIWRSNYTTEYPLYANALWSNLANATNYPTSYPPAGYTMIAAQVGPNSTSTLYSGVNGKGNNTHGGPGNVFWEDEDASWIDDSEDRDIYRYVTYIQDAGGNWSVATGGYTLNVNADRATNYWLGDYSRDVYVGDPDAGTVLGPDLSLLSAVYFTSTAVAGGPTPNFYDIGPENAENGIGKGQPDPDSLINFSDLVPFSFNFGVVGANTFSVPALPPVAFSNLDETPSLTATLLTEEINSADATLNVVVNLTGNGTGVLKALETQLKYNSDVLEVVSVTAGGVVVNGGLPWNHARDLDGSVVIAAAAMGDGATIADDATLAMIEFRWISESIGITELELFGTHMADGIATVIDGASSTLSLRNTAIVPAEFSLGQNYPNPFNPETSIPFSLAEPSLVALTIYNMLGQEVRTLVSQPMLAGIHRVNWDGRDNTGSMVGSGVYVYRISAGNFVTARKMMLAR
ncbi:MAG: T9SS type A sorting domain-containing protein [bacterium]|nr:T9SS type A sorting domain-containing protein [bacterium]